MAPLAGREEKTRIPAGTEKGRIVYRHGELFSGPDDLRGYKQKFAPVWEPRYLAYPGRLNLSQVLGDVAALLEGRRAAP
jgi:phosphatidylglycerol lysyltransferase